MKEGHHPLEDHELFLEGNVVRKKPVNIVREAREAREKVKKAKAKAKKKKKKIKARALPEALDLPELKKDKIIPLQRVDEMQPYDPKFEKSIHRIMCYQSAQGDTPKEIAEKTEYSIFQVRNILKSERSRLLIAQIVQDNFEDGVLDLLKGAAVDAVMEIRDLSTSAKSESVRMRSCVDILDRVQGKPIAALPENFVKPSTLSPEDELEEIEKEIEKHTKAS